jgi:hypothetical protein
MKIVHAKANHTNITAFIGSNSDIHWTYPKDYPKVVGTNPMNSLDEIQSHH